MVEGFERRFGFPLLEVYGSTELGLATAPHGDQRVIGAMGGECSHVQVAIAGEDGRLVDRGSLGEIVVRPREPHAIFQGYWARPEETLAAFRDLWFHTGDRGFIRPDGQLVFVDRIKDCIRRRGENISSFEVERAVQLHPSVLEAAAYAVPSDIAEEEVAVAVVPMEGVELEVSELFRFMIEQLPRFAVPRYIRVVEALPKTPSQRVQKFRLREDGLCTDIVDREGLGITVPKE
jgi:crotonobetaine/carnitine-CoA ligase